MAEKIRVRFAPSPTGFMHLGNVRAALINYLFARQKKGKFVLRIEDTDKSRNIEGGALQIIKDLQWLGLKYDEGFNVGGEFWPYDQSERKTIYQRNLDDLIEADKVYRCFCTPEDLEQRRQEQLAAGQPPKYDRRCRHLSDDHIKQKLVAGLSFIWRLKLNDDAVYDVDDMARSTIRFEMKHFSDPALTRHDGSFTFMFANFVDDWKMEITHVIRGEDHLSNSGLQAALFDAFAVELPKFWHLPMLCNKDGKKLSKRDFGFSLNDLRDDGFLPQAICNYLAIVGGTFEQEIQSLGELAQNFNFENLHSTGAIKFDIEKLTWVNHKWIERLSIEKLLIVVKPFLHKQIPTSKNLDDDKLRFILEKVKTDIKTLKDVGDVLGFYFNAPDVDKKKIEEFLGAEKAAIALAIIKIHLPLCDKTEQFLDALKKDAKEKGLKIKEIFGPLRYLLTGKFSGIGMHDLFEMLDDEEIKERLS
jgi:nondiscriminating glutamyl-tRNA synthetase